MKQPQREQIDVENNRKTHKKNIRELKELQNDLIICSCDVLLVIK